LVWETFGRGKNCWREKNCNREIAKGELLKRGYRKPTPRTLYMGFRKAELKKSQREHGTVQVKDVKSYA
jgi:hypothetical protein